MGDNQRNLAQFQASLNPFAGGDPPRSDGNSAASNIPAAAVAAAAMGGPGLWNELNRAMHYNNIQHAAAAAAAYNNSASWNQHQLQAQGENSRYFNSNFDRESENGSSPSIPRRIPSKGETKATPPLPPLSPHQIGGEMYRTLLAHQYDQYMAALAANLPTAHPPSPSPPSHRSLPPPANSPSSPVPTPRFSPQSQQKQAAAFLAVVAAATNRGHPSSLINGGDRLVSMPQVSPSGAPSHLTSSPSPSPLSGGEGSDADERSKHRRKQGQPRRQNVSSLPSDGSPTLPSDDSGSNRKSSPSANSLPSPPLTHDSLLPVRHPSDMPISQAMSHALAHPFLAAHLNPPSTPNHSNRNSPISPNLSNHSPLNSPKKSHLKGDHNASDMLQTLSGSNNPNSLGSESQHSNKSSNIQINNNSKVHGSLQRDSNVNSQKIDDQADSCRSSIAGNNPSPSTDLGNSITTATNSYCRDDASPLPTTPGSCYSVDSEPPRTSNLAKIDQTRTVSPLPSSPVVRNSSNGPFPRFAATPREVPVDMGSGPSTQYVEEDNIDIPCNNNKQFNCKLSGTKTPAQKKSLSPLKTINLAALDNLYDDNNTSAEKSTSVETVSKTSTNEETSMSNSSDSTVEQSLISNKNTININLSETTASRKRELDKKKISTATNKLRNKFKGLNSNESRLNEVINNCTKTHTRDSLVNGIDEQISANSKFSDGEESLVNGDCHATLSPTQSMKKIKKRKGQKESLSSPDSLEDGLEGTDTRRITRQKRAVSYVEDATDPVLETREDGLSQLSPGLISPGRKRGRRSKLAEFPSDGLVDALSPSSTATSDSFKDSISPERESVSVSVVSPTGGRGRRGRGRGRPPLNHYSDTSPSKEPITSPASDESKVYDFPDPLPSNKNITSPNSRGKRGRGRKRGSPNKNNDRISKSANKSTLPNSVAIPSDDISEAIQHNIVLNDGTSFPTNEDNCNSYTKAPSSDINNKHCFPFLTVKDPSVLLEKYVSNSENIRGFPSLPNYSQCLINSHENDSSGDGFPPSVAATDEVQKEDEAPPSIQYIPRMGRNRDSAMNSSRQAASKESNVIEQVLLSLDKNIDDLSNSNKNIQQPPGNVAETSNFQCSTLEPSKEGNRCEADGNSFNDSLSSKNSSPITRNRIKDPHSAAVQNLQLKSKGRKKEYPMEMNATVLTEKLSLEPPNQPSLVQTSKPVNIDNIEETERNMDRDIENMSYENSSTYATSIAEAVMRSGGRRTSSGKSQSQDSSSNLAEDSSSSSSSIIQSTINSNSSTPTKGRRSTRRSSQKANEPEVVQVEIHPEPQSSLSSYDPNSYSVEQRKPDDPKGPSNHNINVCAKLRERVSNPPQNNMDDITVVPDVEPAFELRSRNTGNSSTERAAPSRCSKVTSPKSPKGVKTNSSDRKRANSSSRFPKVQPCKKLKLDDVTDEKTDTGSSDIKESVSEIKSDLIIADETSVTDSEQLKNDSPSTVDVPKTVIDGKINAEASPSNVAQPSTSSGDRPLRPKRTPKPPQTEEQINEVLMLLNMDSEESEDEDYVPKQMTVDSDQSMDESDDNASNSDFDQETSVKNDNSLDGEISDNQVKKNPQKRYPKTGLKRKKKSRGGSKLLKSGSDSKKRKVLIEKRPVVPDESVVERSPFVQLIPSSGGEYINNDPSASVYEPQPPKSSLIHFHTELDSKNKAACRVGFNSTLHTNYDAFSKDLTWFCSVCKKFSHSNQLGDLFGPLYISGLELVKKNCQTVVDGQAQTDGRDAESAGHSRGRKRAGNIKHEVNSGSPAVSNSEKKEDGSSSPPWRFVPTATPARILSRVGLNTPDRCSLSSMSTKIVTRLDLPAGGITIGPGGTSNWPEKTDVKEVDSSPPGAEECQSSSETRGTETWIHESCLLWLPGVNVVNSRLRGIEESIILAQTNLCSICGETGASIGCLVNGCKNLVHYSCAEAKGWSLDIDTFLSYCNNHKNRKANYSNGGEVISDRGQSSSVSEESGSRKDAGESTT